VAQKLLTIWNAHWKASPARPPQWRRKHCIFVYMGEAPRCKKRIA
jgi:hypothetical protein